ncbi:MAG: hypothetical protein KME45_18605 [Stenomitos rutilans HA7619-LM2]|jgi:hypothetical protein|nr:hypothetical protein [Stenomitos rutilans HA7619-LM2]
MNAHTFDTDSPVCPICHRAGVIKPHKILKGLLTCQNCRERLVVSWSGHYVRDPFSLKPLATGQMLRRESRPLARMQRDFRLVIPSLVWTVLGSAIVIGTAVFLVQNAPIKRTPSTHPLPSPTNVERSPKLNQASGLNKS